MCLPASLPPLYFEVSQVFAICASFACPLLLFVLHLRVHCFAHVLASMHIQTGACATLIAQLFSCTRASKL